MMNDTQSLNHATEFDDNDIPMTQIANCDPSKCDHQSFNPWKGADVRSTPIQTGTEPQ